MTHVGSDQVIKPMQAVSNFLDSDEANIITARHESSLFSSSLSDLFSRKHKFSLQNCMLKFLMKTIGSYAISLYALVRTVGLSTNNALHRHSVDAIASHYEEEKLVSLLKNSRLKLLEIYSRTRMKMN